MTGVELESLITEVKDILPHLGGGFVVVSLFLSLPSYLKIFHLKKRTTDEPALDKSNCCKELT